MVFGGHGLYHADESGGVDLGSSDRDSGRIAAVQTRRSY